MAVNKVRTRVKVHSYNRDDRDQFSIVVKGTRREKHLDPRWNREDPTMWMSFERRGIEVVAFVTVAQLKALRAEVDAAIAVAEEEPVPCHAETCGYCKDHPESRKESTAT